MEVWELLRPSFRRLAAISVVAILAAVAAVVLTHAKTSYQSRSSVYFAQALGVDSTSYSVDPTAAQLQGVLALPSVQTSAAQAADVPLTLVKAATVAHTAGSPIITVTTKDPDAAAAGRAGPALARAGLAYFAQQGVDRAQSVEQSAIADLGTANTQLQTFVASAGVANVDTAVADASAAVATDGPDTAAGQAAAATLARLEALQPQYDLLQTEVAGARTTVANAYTAVGTARSVASAVTLPGNVVTDPSTAVSGLTAVIRAAVSAIVVVFLVGIGGFGLVDLRRRRRAAPAAPAGGPALGRPAPEALPAKAGVGTGAGDDFPLLLGPAAADASAVAELPVGERPDVEPENPYLVQAKRLAAERSLRGAEARSRVRGEDRRREVRTALMNASRAAEAQRKTEELPWRPAAEQPADPVVEEATDFEEPQLVVEDEPGDPAAEQSWSPTADATAPEESPADEPWSGGSDEIEGIPAQDDGPGEARAGHDDEAPDRPADLFRVSAARSIEVRVLDDED